MTRDEGTRQVTALTGVYHAEGGLMGELRYVVGKLRGTTHCALCDVTHSVRGMKRGFASCAAALPVPLRLVHLNERSPALRALTEGHTPCVVAHLGDEPRIVLGADQLGALGGSVRAFERALREALQQAGLRL